MSLFCLFLSLFETSSPSAIHRVSATCSVFSWIFNLCVRKPGTKLTLLYPLPFFPSSIFLKLISRNWRRDYNYCQSRQNNSVMVQLRMKSRRRCYRFIIVKKYTPHYPSFQKHTFHFERTKCARSAIFLNKPRSLARTIAIFLRDGWHGPRYVPPHVRSRECTINI